jgi:hypothetical protein
VIVVSCSFKLRKLSQVAAKQFAAATHSKMSVNDAREIMVRLRRAGHASCAPPFTQHQLFAA